MQTYDENYDFSKKNKGKLFVAKFFAFLFAWLIVLTIMIKLGLDDGPDIMGIIALIVSIVIALLPVKLISHEAKCATHNYHYVYRDNLIKDIENASPEISVRFSTEINQLIYNINNQQVYNSMKSKLEKVRAESNKYADPEYMPRELLDYK